MTAGERCYCAACRAGDALNLLKTLPRSATMPMTPDQALRNACQERCAAYGDPPCYEICGREFSPCEECAIELGLIPADPIDDDAVVAPLL